MAARVPPQNLDAERSVLGAILIDTDSINRVADVLRAEHFYDARHALIYQAILELYQSANAAGDSA